MACFLTPGFMPDLPSFLFGSILTISAADLWLLGVLAAVAVAVFACFGRTIVAVAFDEQFARSQGLPAAAVSYAMMVLIAMTIVATLRMVGIVLAISLLTLPQMTASALTMRFRTMACLSILAGLADCLAGLAVSYWLNVPSGAAIIFVSVVVYAAVRLLRPAPRRSRRHGERG